MTNLELSEKLSELIKRERKITNEILSLLQMAMDRRIYLEMGYGSLFDWLTKEFGYSNAAAFRRIEAAKLLKSFPELAQMLEKGSLNLTILSKAQVIINWEERSRAVSEWEKRAAIKATEGKSAQEGEKILLKFFPSAASEIKREKTTVIDAKTIRHSMNLDEELEANLQRAKIVLYHVFPRGRDAEVIGYALKFFLDRRDPIRKNSLPLRKRVAS